MNTWLARCLARRPRSSPPPRSRRTRTTPRTPTRDDEPRARTRPRRSDAYDRRRKPVDETDEFREVAEQEGDETGFQKPVPPGRPQPGRRGGVPRRRPAAGQLPRRLRRERAWGSACAPPGSSAALIDNETLREALWADLRWTYGSLSDGTDVHHAGTRAFTTSPLAPAYEFKLRPVAFGCLRPGRRRRSPTRPPRITVGDGETEGERPQARRSSTAWASAAAPPRLRQPCSLAFRLEAMALPPRLHERHSSSAAASAPPSERPPPPPLPRAEAGGTFFTPAGPRGRASPGTSQGVGGWHAPCLHSRRVGESGAWAEVRR